MNTLPPLYIFVVCLFIGAANAADSHPMLESGQWQDINLTLKGVSPNNLKYLKLSINMANLQFDTVQSAETRQRKNKK